jgi:hypothetical protein
MKIPFLTRLLEIKEEQLKLEKENFNALHRIELILVWGIDRANDKIYGKSPIETLTKLQRGFKKNGK